MPVETRTRIVLFLPTPATLPQFYLVDGVLTDLTDACGGVTVSSDIPAVFTGFWSSISGTQKDENLLVLADAPTPIGDTDFSL